ncbi:hypothetical protein X777_04893 [Ooceraea biroi]|uniref:Uncharacterized protein n=1 Tax=Ooceraea biroi TaxID=2015173 RepID=A0A026WHS1_OOCBI|nr:hypothetical protein X777_04893 [Ooceraea biroi]
MVDDTAENEHGTFRGLGELGTVEARTPCPKIAPGSGGIQAAVGGANATFLRRNARRSGIPLRMRRRAASERAYVTCVFPPPPPHDDICPYH